MKGERLERVAELANGLLEGLGRVVVGYRREQRLLVAALLANGHVLLEGVPGIAKTTMVKALARMLGLAGYEREIAGVRFKGFSRIQFTPDLLPGDVTGSLVWNPAKAGFEVQLGPIFAYLVLADEINRASPRTQSALLEAMQERQVTIAGKRYPLEDRAAGKWFLVMATQNPVEQEGTYPLPEAQLDRFLVRLVLGYPGSLEEEAEAYSLHLYRLSEPLEDLEPLTSPEQLAEAQEAVAEQVRVPRELVNTAARLVRLTRPEVSPAAGESLLLGASPRAGIALLRYAKALAALEARDTVAPGDLLDAVWPVLNHRVIPRLDRIVEKGGGPRARLEVVWEGLRPAAEAALGKAPPTPPPLA